MDALCLTVYVPIVSLCFEKETINHAYFKAFPPVYLHNQANILLFHNLYSHKNVKKAKQNSFQHVPFTLIDVESTFGLF